MTVTKETIIKQIGIDTGMSRFEAKRVLDTFLQIVYNTLGGGEDVLISGFGKFKVLSKNSRLGRNPHTMEEIKLQARRVVTFRASENLRIKTNYSAEYLRQASDAERQFQMMTSKPEGNEPLN
jgi:integration host factor subunit alpha